MDISQVDSNDLVFSARYGRIRAVKALLETGADINSTGTIFGDNALTIAATVGHIEIVNELLKSGADINFKDKAGCTSLMRAVIAGHTHIVETLIKFGADVNTHSLSGETPLICAVIIGNIDILKLLLKAGADIHEIDNNKKSILDYVPEKEIFNLGFGMKFFTLFLKKRDEKIVRILENAGA
jgi:ankyrin repeat protein